jgi:tRNA pseudouridine13 synthase
MRRTLPGRPMKLKCQPEDFHVEELPLVAPAETGRYTLYRLSKRNIGTIEAVLAIRRGWNLAGHVVSYGGLKDRHAVTIQYLTIMDGPRKSLSGQNFELEPIGRLAHAYGPDHFRGNRFQLVVRDLAEDNLRRATTEIEAISRDGLPNYFDDQRFGSVGFSGQFIGHAWLLGDHERALKLALGDPNPFDRSGAKVQKALIRESWGRWPELKARLERSSERSIVTYLVDHPTDYRGAFARLRRELRTLYFSAFQSHLWNLILAGWLESQTRSDQRVPVDLKVGVFPFPRRLEPDQVAALTETAIPLPCARSSIPNGPLGALAQAALARFQLEWSDLRVKHLKDVFFSKGTRAGLVFPQNVDFSAAKDELHRGRHSLRVSFDLSKGLYATILVKRITDVAERA